MADVGDECAPVITGGRAERVVAAAELDNVAASRDCGVVARVRRGRNVSGRCWGNLDCLMIYVQHLNVVGHIVYVAEKKRGRAGGWKVGTRRRCCGGGCLKRNVSHLPAPFSASFRDFFQPAFRPVDLEFRNSATSFNSTMHSHSMTKHFTRSASSAHHSRTRTDSTDNRIVLFYFSLEETAVVTIQRDLGRSISQASLISGNRIPITRRPTLVMARWRKPADTCVQRQRKTYWSG